MTLCSCSHNGASGGDQIITNLAQFWPNVSASKLLTTKAAVPLLENPEFSVGQTSKIIIDEGSKEPRNILLAYLFRSIRVYRKARKLSKAGLDIKVLICGSPYIPDIAVFLALSKSADISLVSWQANIYRPRIRAAHNTIKRSRHESDKTWNLILYFKQLFSYLNQELALRLLIRRNGFVLVPNIAMAQEAEQRGIPSDHILQMRVGIAPFILDTHYPPKPNGALIHSGQDISFVFVGRFHPSKGIEDLLEAWQYLTIQAKQRQLTIRLDIVGAGDSFYAQRLTESISHLPGKVRYHGLVTGDDKFAIMAAADVLIFPSYHESFGVVILEALALGTAVVGYDLPSTREFFDSLVAQVSVGDVKSLADAALYAALNDSIALADKRRMYAATFSWPSIVTETHADIIARELLLRIQKDRRRQ